MDMIATLEAFSTVRRSPDMEVPVQITAVQVAIDLAEREDLAETTRTSYRSALVWFLRTQQDQSPGNRLAYAYLMEWSREKRTDARPAPKPKAISEEDLDDLVCELAAMAERSPLAERSQHWVQATLACGARPIEWMKARWLDVEQTQLEIHTAKQKLSEPAFRQAELDLGQIDSPYGDEDTFSDDLDERPKQSYLLGTSTRVIPIARASDRLAITFHMARFQEAVPEHLEEMERLEAFNRFYDNCAKTIRRACNKLWGNEKRYSLKTMRSQFSANHKAALGAAATAVLMGHSDPDSPTAAHYGKGNQAHSRFKGMRQGQDVRAAETIVDGQETGESAEAPG